MSLYQYDDLLSLLRIITNITIPLLFIIFYKISKDKVLLFFIQICIIELIIIELEIYNINFILKYISDIYIICVITKLFLLFVLAKKNKSNNTGYTFPIIFIFMLVYVDIKTSFMGIKIYEIIINLYIINLICLSNIYLKCKENQLNKNKLFINKQYISKTIDQIEEEAIKNSLINEKIKSINDQLASVVEVIDIPIVIIKISTNECIFKNKYFDEFLLSNNFKIEEFNPKEFIKVILDEESDDIFNKIKYIDNSKENFIKIKLFNNKYNVVLAKDFYDDEEVIVCEIKDITEISIEEEKLKRSELRYKTLMDILSDGIIIHDGTTVTYMNKIGMDIFELDTYLCTIDKILKAIDKNNRNKFKQNLVSLSKGVKEEEKSKIQLENGKIVDFISTTFVLNNKQMILTIVRDCTEYEVALNKLEESKKTYLALLKTLPEGIILVNKYTKKQVYANRYMMRLLKDVGIEVFNEIIDSYIENRSKTSFKTFYMNNTKNRKISIAIEEVPKQNNLLIIVRDLQIEQQMETEYNNLKIIKERNKFKTEFLTRVSSNLKKPINTIFEVNKFLDNNKEICNYEGIKSYTRTVRQNSYRLKRLLNNIEEVSNIEAGIYFREYKTYNLINYLEKLVELCREYTKQKGLDISFESNKREVLIYMDKAKIEKIILNLLSNSIKFTETGGKIIVLLTVNKKDVIIGIKDNGSGIPSNKIDFIFENFEQVNRSLSRTAEGTGVGLYLVKKLALVHHAMIKVNSKIGYGSKFEIILKDNFLESTKENRSKVEDIVIDRESIDLEFSDIYLA
ncbi:ATP-binding protein [Terrisporobacter sp.]